MNADTYHLGPKLSHVLVRPFPEDYETRGWFIECNGCGRTLSANEGHLRADPECVAREVESHRKCGEGG